MQNVLALKRELIAATALNYFERAAIVTSAERWSPVAAVVLEKFSASDGMAAHTFDLRIPIPDLYGFVHSCSSVILDAAPALGQASSEGVMVPWVRPIAAEMLVQHHPYYVDVRERGESYLGKYVLHLTPEWDPKGFAHRTLSTFIHLVREFFEDPATALRRDLELCSGRWLLTKNPWWLHRMIELNTEIGDAPAVHQLVKLGCELFPARQEFSMLAARLVLGDPMRSPTMT